MNFHRENIPFILLCFCATVYNEGNKFWPWFPAWADQGMRGGEGAPKSRGESGCCLLAQGRPRRAEGAGLGPDGGGRGGCWGWVRMGKWTRWTEWGHGFPGSREEDGSIPSIARPLPFGGGRGEERCGKEPSMGVLGASFSLAQKECP